MDKVFIKEIYNQLIDRLIEKEPVSLHQAVVNGAILGEYIVKKQLSKKSPLAPYRLDYLRTAHSDLALLIAGEETSEQLKYEDLGILLDRAKALGVMDEGALDLIAKIKAYRNMVMHDPDCSYDDLEASARLLELLTKHSKVIKTVLGLELTKKQDTQLQQTLRYVESKINNRLSTKITAARETFFSLTKVERGEHIRRGIWHTGAEDSLIGGMLCPSCKNNTLHYLFSIDFDYSRDGGSTVHGGAWLECIACDLNMSEYDFDELWDNPSYADKKKPDISWKEYYDHKHLEENAYEYM